MLAPLITTQLLLDQAFEKYAANSALRQDGYGAEFSYQSLRAALNAGARALTTGGLKKDDVIAIVMRRSRYSVLSTLLAIHAGVPFVPIDPEHGALRARHLLEMVRPKLVISDAAAELQLEQGFGASWSCEIWHPESVFCSPVEEDLGQTKPYRAATTPRDLAYLLPTSGTTGTPKLVMMPHAALLNRIQWGQRTYPLQSDDVVLHWSSPGFDYALWETVAPLCFGAQVLVGGPDIAAPEAMGGVLDRHRVTCLHFVPSLLREHLDMLRMSSLKDLRYVMCGGEALDPQLLEELTRAVDRAHRTQPVRVFNQYGPAEACIDCTCWGASALSPENARVPIGAAIDGVQTYVLDAELREIASGAVGRLYVSGECLAWGYHADPRQTAQRFVPNPFPDAPRGSRLYDTGDRVRCNEQGLLEFVGRGDEQLKIRGVRIEPLEVQHELVKHPKVREAAVAIDGGALVAFVVSADNSLEHELRKYLLDRFPLAAVPQRIVPCAQFPRLASGKVDLSALSSLSRRAPASPPAHFSEPPLSGHRDPFSVEAQLRKLWTSILEVDSLNGTEDFFELGGHSLLATRLVARVRKTFGIDLPLRQLWITPTPSALAAVIDKALTQGVA